MRHMFRIRMSSFRDAPLGAGPESILTIVVMDSGLALRAPRNDELNRLSRIRHRGGEAAVDRDRLSVDIGRIVAGEKKSHCRELMRLAGALERIELADLFVR